MQQLDFDDLMNATQVQYSPEAKKDALCLALPAVTEQ